MRKNKHPFPSKGNVLEVGLAVKRTNNALTQAIKKSLISAQSAKKAKDLREPEMTGIHFVATIPQTPFSYFFCVLESVSIWLALHDEFHVPSFSRFRV